jgi:hypothetical protein
MAYPPQPVDTSVQPLPVPSAYNPITAVFKAVRGWNKITDATPNDSYAIAVSPEDGGKATFTSILTGFTPVATATDILTIGGSASKVIRITRLMIWGTANAAGQYPLFLIKRSAANTAGTTATITPTPHDSGNAAVTAAVKNYTANATGLGAAVGTLRLVNLWLTVGGTPTQNVLYIEEFGNRPAQAIVLRGVAEFFCLNFNGVAVPAGTSLNIFIEHTEE